jgi:hypothetical protein
VGESGSPGPKFKRACAVGNVALALAYAADLPKPLALDHALQLTVVFAKAGDRRFEPAAVRWLGRLAERRDLTLAALRIATEAMFHLPDETAVQTLSQIARGAPITDK